MAVNCPNYVGKGRRGLVINSVPEIVLSGTQNQPKNGLKSKLKEAFFILFQKNFRTFLSFFHSV